MRRLSLLFIAGMCLLGLVAVAPPSGHAVAAERACFDGVPYCAENAFLAFWKGNGGLEILGLPVSQPFVDDRGLIVQYYERAIMEWHPENGPQYQVLLTLLGGDRLGVRPERAAPPIDCVGDCAYLEQTKHTLRGTFLNYWQANGGLPVFGFPLTEQFIETNTANGQQYTVQYFERNRFELHPESADPRYRVLLGRLGAETLQNRRQVLDRPIAQVPDYTRPLVTVGVPNTLAIPAIGVSAPVEQVGLDAKGNMDVPKNPNNTAWYAPGARPGQPGNSVIAGHVDYRGIGPVVFWNLRNLTPGTEVFVTDDAGKRRRFVVTAVEVYPADNAPLERIFGGAPDSQLNLISCIGDFDPGTASYNNRIVVYSRWDGVTP